MGKLKYRHAFCLLIKIISYVLEPTSNMEYYSSGIDYYNKGEYDKAFLHFKKAACKNHAESQFRLGEMYNTGIFVEPDEVKALDCYIRSLNNGFSAARIKIGLIYYQSKTGSKIKPDYEKAVRILRDVIDINEREACYYIASIYAEGGFGIQKDFNLAKMWYQKFFHNPWGNARVNLGMIYFKGGNGIEKNYQIALDFWLKSFQIAFNIIPSYVCIGILYTLRDDGYQDFKEAMSWFKLSINHYCLESLVPIGMFYEKGLGVDRDYNEAMNWYKKACVKNIAQGFVSLGLLYQNGLGIPQNFDKAYTLYETALNTNGNNESHGDAMACLGILYQYGLGVTTSHTKAIEYFQKSVDLGSLYGYNCMGNAYKYGCGVDINYEKAFQWYLKCDNCYDDTVHFWENNFRITLRFCDEGWLNIGIMYLNGLGTNINKELALVYLEKALKFGNDEARFYINHINNVTSWPSHSSN